MVDVHCHILPGLDDGPDDLDGSLAMAESAIADGITHVVATPHANADFHFDFLRVQRLREELQTRVAGRLVLSTGCDFHLSAENLVALRGDPQSFCINQRNCLLVEFSQYSVPPSMDQTLHEIQLLGLRPIITHPERNPILRAQAHRLANWVRLGCYVQVTAGSLTGVFGPSAQKESWRWIADGLVHIVATDAHNTHTRQLKLRPAYDLVREEFGKEKAEALFVENPMAAYEGRDFPYIPCLPQKAESRRKRFFFF